MGSCRVENGAVDTFPAHALVWRMARHVVRDVLALCLTCMQHMEHVA